jgi:hypothetical protein
MTETLTITQMISEEKLIRQKIVNLIGTDFKAISYYQKNRPYVGARTVEEQTRDQKEKWQTLQDLLKRLKAIKSAHTKANHTTIVTVPCEPDLAALIRGEDVGIEQITIAEAINRKNAYRTRKGNNAYSDEMISMEKLALNLLNLFSRDFNAKTEYDRKAEEEVDEQMARKFPQDSKQNWSQERYNEERKKEQTTVEVQRIDPLNLIGTNAVQKYFNAIQDYLAKIDVILSEVNASTKVEVKY